MTPREERERRRLWKAAATGVFFLLCACLSYAYLRPAEVTTLRVGFFTGSNWGVPDGDSYAVMDAAIAQFEAEYPDVRVTYVSGIRKGDYAEWLAERMVAGDEPDVFVVLADDFDLYAKTGALADLTEEMERDGEVSAEAFYPAAFGFGQSGGHSYALPMECETTLLFVNKTLLAREGIAMPQADWTWQDFLAICRAVTRDTDGDGVIDQFGAYGYGWQHAAVTNGAEPFRSDGRAAQFATGEMEEAVRFVYTLRQLARGQEVTARDFDMGRVAFRPFTFAAYRTYKPYPWRIKKYMGFEWDCIPLPAGPSGRSVSPIGTLLMGMSARTKHRALAWAFLKSYCYGEAVQRLVLRHGQALPARRSVLEEASAAEVFGTDAQSARQLTPHAISDLLAGAVLPPKFARYEEALQIADTEIQKFLSGSAVQYNAMNRLQKELNDYLQR